MGRRVRPRAFDLSGDGTETSGGGAGQPLCCPMNRSYLNLLMLRSESSQSKSLPSNLKIRIGHATNLALWLLATFLSLPSSASAQAADFTLQAGPFSPDAVAPGGTSSSNVTIGAAVNGSSGTVNLTCQVSSTQATTSTPGCAVSPTTVTFPAGATATITTTLQTTTVGYSITITGTDSSGTLITPPQSLTVLAVTPQFTISVQSPVVPGSVPAGSGSEGVIILNPINGYISPTRQIGSQMVSGITLACTSITPLVSFPPVCSFNPPSPRLDGTAITSTLTISTNGPTITGAVAHPRSFYALWMPVPMLALVGLGAAVGGKGSRKAWGWLGLFVIGGTVFLMPACGNTTPTTSALKGVTPNNTYSFTVVGVDADGVVSSNTASAVTLTVTSPVI